MPVDGIDTDNEAETDTDTDTDIGTNSIPIHLFGDIDIDIDADTDSLTVVPPFLLAFSLDLVPVFGGFCQRAAPRSAGSDRPDRLRSRSLFDALSGETTCSQSSEGTAFSDANVGGTAVYH